MTNIAQSAAWKAFSLARATRTADAAATSTAPPISLGRLGCVGV